MEIHEDFLEIPLWDELWSLNKESVNFNTYIILSLLFMDVVAIRSLLTEPEIVVGALDRYSWSLIRLVRCIIFVIILFLELALGRLVRWTRVPIHTFYLIHIEDLGWHGNHVLKSWKKVWALICNRLRQIYRVLRIIEAWLVRESHYDKGLLLRRLLLWLLVHHLILKLVHHPLILLLH